MKRPQPFLPFFFPLVGQKVGNAEVPPSERNEVSRTEPSHPLRAAFVLLLPTSLLQPLKLPGP